MPSRIDDYQRRKIYAIAGVLGMKGKDQYDPLHDLVADLTGKQHISELTKAEAYDVIAELEKKQGDNPLPRKRGRPRHKNTPGRISEGQQRKIWALMYQLAEASPSKAQVVDRLCAIIKKTLGVEAFPAAPFAWITYKGANTLIEALKGYVMTAQKKAGGAP